MPHRRRPALTLIAALWVAAPPVAAAPALDYVGTFVWTDDRPSFGGFSGIEIGADGTRFHALSDRATLVWGSIERDAQGVIRAMNVAGRAALRDSDGTPLPPGYLGDSEGLAIGSDGTIWVSFEGLNRVARYADPDAPARLAPDLPDLAAFRSNTGLEALAIDPDGQILAVPERSGGASVPFPVLRLREGAWDQPFSIPRSGPYLPVGADFGPDGWLYLLERDFQGILGFASRVRRFRIDGDRIAAGETLLETRRLQYDNLEGISVWEDGQSLRLTMISDDNFLFLQRTELVEYRLRPPADRAARP